MWSLPAGRDRKTATALALGFHCSVFKKRLSDDRTRRWCRRDTRHHSAGCSPVVAHSDPLGPARWAARSKAGNKRWCQPVPSFRAQGAAGVRGEEPDYRFAARESNSVI